MSDEIKEILDYFRKYMTIDDCIRLNKIEDYITNLQEELKSANESITWWTNRFKTVEKENERLKELCDKYEEEHSNEFKIWKDERHQLLDYKSRCEKAIEYINEYRNGWNNWFEFTIDDKIILLNILGGDKE